VLAQVHGGVGGDQLRRVLDVALRKRVALGDQPANLLDETRDRAGIFGITFDEQLVALRADADIQQSFEVSQVVVVGSEERGEPVLVDGNAASGDSSDRDISLCYKELTDHTRLAPQGAQGQGRLEDQPLEAPRTVSHPQSAPGTRGQAPRV
jgi:hypothetical protein